MVISIYSKGWEAVKGFLYNRFKSKPIGLISGFVFIYEVKKYYWSRLAESNRGFKYTSIHVPSRNPTP